MPGASAEIRNDDIRRALTDRGAGRWAAGTQAPPAGMPAATSQELWALLQELTPTDEARLFGPGLADVTQILRSATYQWRDEEGDIKRQYWLSVVAYRPDEPGVQGRHLGVVVHANSTDQNPGLALGVDTHHRVDEVIFAFNDLCSAKRARGFRAKPRSGPGSLTFNALAVAAARLGRS